MGLVPSRFEEEDAFERGWGICFGPDLRITYGMDHGYFQWMPHSLQVSLSQVWNRLVCMVKGHDDIGVQLWKADEPGERYDPPVCTYCMTELPVDGKYVTEDMLTKPHWRDVPPIPGLDYPIEFVTDQKIVDAYNLSRPDWIAKGWVEHEHNLQGGWCEECGAVWRPDGTWSDPDPEAAKAYYRANRPKITEASSDCSQGS